MRYERIKVNEKIGYKTSNGTIVIDPIYDDGSLFLDDYASVVKDGKCGVIDQYGNAIVPFLYDEAYHLFDKLFAVRRHENNKWSLGVIDEKGKEILPFEYEYVNHFGHFIQCYKKASSKRKHSMDTNGRVYDYHRDWYEIDNELWFNQFGNNIYVGYGEKSVFDYLIIKEDNEFGLIDDYGRKILPCCYEEIFVRRRNRFVVCQKEEDGKIHWGVIDDDNRIVISIEYDNINNEKPCCDNIGDGFFQCFTHCNPECEGVTNGKYHNNPSNSTGQIWFNIDGVRLHQGKAKILSDDFLAVFANDSWGIVTQTGEKVVNYQYDDVAAILGKLVVKKHNKFGVLDKHGGVIITPSYTCIENVSVQDGIFYEDYYVPSSKRYGCYSKECIFDTGNEKSYFFQKKVNVSINTIRYQDYYNFDNLFILTGEGYSELFSVKDGIVPQTRYDEIRVLTNNAFAVRQGNKWGVLCAVSKGQLVIPCDFDRIKYEGGSVVLLCKNGLWGAKSFSINIFRGIVNVPVEFLEIGFLNESQTLFSVKRSKTGYDDKVREEYTVVDKKGCVYGKMGTFNGLESPCKFYNENRILTSYCGKYGFVSANGYVSIPFKYEEIEEREDGLFSVRIKVESKDDFGDQITADAWGVLDISGKEIVCVKYSEKIPLKWNGIKVVDAATGLCGVLAANGTEQIPSIYEHLILDGEYIYFGYGGYDYSNDSGNCPYNFFSEYIEHAIWGCMDRTGRILIDARYDCFKHDGNYILAGRDGNMLGEGQYSYSYHYSEYGGIYDLFTYEGTLLFGGFNKFECFDDLFLFHFGGEWKEECEEYDEFGNNIGYHSYHFEKGNGRWLVTDTHLKSIIKNKDGERVKFYTGFKGLITTKETEKGIVHYWNMPLELFSLRHPEIEYGLMICSHDKGTFVVRVEDGLQTDYYCGVQIISDRRFFFKKIINEEGCVGMAEIKQSKEGETYCKHVLETEKNGFKLLTYPVNDFVFGVFEISTNNYTIRLYDLKEPDQEPMTAISSIGFGDMIEYVREGLFKISIKKGTIGLKQIVVQRPDIFDTAFRQLISEKESGIPIDNNKDNYWFTVYDLEVDYEGEEYERDYERRDYLQDTWDAMTDGQYGDMPDGFDGDYSFMGY